MLLNMDCYGTRRSTCEDRAGRQQFLTADINRAIHIHQTSLNLNDDSRMQGGSQGKLLAVAEGIGDDPSATRASTIAIDCLSRSMLYDHHEKSDHTERDIDSHLANIMQACQEAIGREAETIDAYQGMSARLGIGYVSWPNLHLVHVGPIHCMLLRNGWLTEYASASDGGAIGEDQGRLHPVVKRVPLRMGDRVLISTSPLFETLTEFDCKYAMSSNDSASAICDALVAAAQANGPLDCSLIVACFDEGVSPDADAVTVDHSLTAESEAPKQTPSELPVSTSTDDGADRGAQRPAESPS